MATRERDARSPSSKRLAKEFADKSPIRLRETILPTATPSRDATLATTELSKNNRSGHHSRASIVRQVDRGRAQNLSPPSVNLTPEFLRHTKPTWITRNNQPQNHRPIAAWPTRRSWPNLPLCDVGNGEYRSLGPGRQPQNQTAFFASDDASSPALTPTHEDSISYRLALRLQALLRQEMSDSHDPIHGPRNPLAPAAGITAQPCENRLSGRCDRPQPVVVSIGQS